jgi:hypothetical protein
MANPEAGDVEPGTGGLRKIRMADPTLTPVQKAQLREISQKIREHS